MYQITNIGFAEFKYLSFSQYRIRIKVQTTEWLKKMSKHLDNKLNKIGSWRIFVCASQRIQWYIILHTSTCPANQIQKYALVTEFIIKRFLFPWTTVHSLIYRLHEWNDDNTHDGIIILYKNKKKKNNARNAIKLFIFQRIIIFSHTH